MGIFTTPRPVPARTIPAAAGTLVVLVALPIFLLAGWPIGAWGLAAVLWAVGEALGFGLGRLPLGLDNLAASGMVAVGMTFRVIAVMVVFIALAASGSDLALPAALLFIAAYTVELAVSLLAYFTGGMR
jgi:hypothetical protein